MEHPLLRSIGLLVLLSIGIHTNGQSSILWHHDHGGSQSEYFRDMLRTDDGGYLVVGEASSADSGLTANLGGSDAWVVKLDTVGAIQWQSVLGGSADDRALAVAPTSDGGFVIAGQTASNDGDVTGNHGDRDAWLVKLDGTGALQWQRCYGGSALDGFQGVLQTDDGGFALGGSSYSNDGDVIGHQGGGDGWLVRTDASGNILWQHCLGGTSPDNVQTLIAAPGGFYASGWTFSNDGNIAGHHGNSDAFVAHVDGSGTLLWATCYGGSGAELSYHLAPLPGGDLVMAGSTNSSDNGITGVQGLQDVWIVRIDTLGAIAWQHCLGGNYQDEAQCIHPTQDGGFILLGSTNSNTGDVVGSHGNVDAWLVKTNSTGDLEWQRCIGGMSMDIGATVLEIGPGDYIASGWTMSGDGDLTGLNGGMDGWIMRLSDLALAMEDAPAGNETQTVMVVQTELRVDLSPEVTQAWLIDVTGRVVNAWAPTPGLNVVPIGHLPSGAYLLRTTEGRSERFIKE